MTLLETRCSQGQHLLYTYASQKFPLLNVIVFQMSFYTCSGKSPNEYIDHLATII